MQGSLGYSEGVGFTLYYTTNFIFTGLAVAVAAHAGMFNIGGEGQAYVGGLGVTLACLALDHYVPWYVTFPFALLGAVAVSVPPGQPFRPTCRPSVAVTS